MVKNWLKRTKNIFILFLPIVIYLIPVSFFENNDSICLFKLLMGNECYGCGITRAVVNMVHFEFDKAIAYNKLIIAVFPLLLYIWFRNVIEVLKE